jgi:hypothetical protein
MSNSQKLKLLLSDILVTEIQFYQDLAELLLKFALACLDSFARRSAGNPLSMKAGDKTVTFQTSGNPCNECTELSRRFRRDFCKNLCTCCEIVPTTFHWIE